MLNLVVHGEKTSNTVEFEMAKNNNDIDVYANNNLVGWFTTNADGKIQFNTAQILGSLREIIAVTEKNELFTC